MQLSRSVWSGIGLLAITAIAGVLFTSMRVVSIDTAVQGAALHIITAATEVAPLVVNVSEIADVRDKNRAELIAAVREKLAYAPPASVEATPESILEDVYADEAEGTESDVLSVTTGSRAVQWCDATVFDAVIAASWPVDGAVVEQGLSKVEALAQLSSGEQVSLLEIPLGQPLRAEPECLQHNYVGITSAGRLVHNGDGILYSAYSERDLIGYALDGHPIYGPIVDTSELDACGGQRVAGGYQYHLRPGDDFLVGCFVSDPVELVPRG